MKNRSKIVIIVSTLLVLIVVSLLLLTSNVFGSGELSAYNGWVKVNGQIKNFYITSTDKCSSMYICTEKESSYNFEKLSFCVNEEGAAVGQLTGEIADPFTHCESQRKVVYLDTEECYNTYLPRNKRRFRTVNEPVKGYVIAVNDKNGYYLTKYGWCQYKQL